MKKQKHSRIITAAKRRTGISGGVWESGKKGWRTYVPKVRASMAIMFTSSKKSDIHRNTKAATRPYATKPPIREIKPLSTHTSRERPTLPLYCRTPLALMKMPDPEMMPMRTMMLSARFSSRLMPTLSVQSWSSSSPLSLVLLGSSSNLLESSLELVGAFSLLL
ncbi:hypothetical protein E2C01_004349 [Portunus trituberculatus]|uniref:Uncharacterized protein n=1 Tax=Portunus trituberculatus TaxID=210409 RepID=A0A5B7CPN3_PORTR|nr:hypothetical protein [Portunus trituberculatus]